MFKDISILDAKNEAQKIAFAPLLFQAVISMKELGILHVLSRNKKGISIGEIAKQANISEYGVKVLVEAAETIGVAEFLENGDVALTKVGFVMNSDPMTNVNLNFVNDVCYNGAKFLSDCIREEKPVGLKTLGNWKTIYEGLASLPDQIKKSWFGFDHYYSDGAFPAALEIVFKEKPKYLFDIGGNTGKWAIACCKYDPNVKVKILDLPGQLNVSKKNAEEKNLLDRIDFHQIDILDTLQKIPEGADAIWMSQFLDCFSDHEIFSILQNVRQASNEKTKIYILEPFIDNQKYEAAKLSLVGTSLYFTAMANGNSKIYSMHEMETLIKKAGLKVIERHELIGDSYHTILRCGLA